jgi:drug/metabolite transporter (DMT)-like permease
MRVHSRAGGFVQVAIAAILWGTWSVFLRTSRIDPRWSTPLVFATMTLLGLPLLARPAARSAAAGRTTHDFVWLVVLGVSDAANAWLFFLAMDRTTVALAVLSHYLAPALVSVIAPYLAQTPRQKFAVVRALCATAGLVLVMEPWNAHRSGSSPWLGALMGAGSACFYAINVCAVKRLSVRFTAEEQLVFHSAIAAPIVGLAAPWTQLPTLRSIAWMVAGGGLIGITAALLFVRGLARIPPEHASLLTFLEPLTAVLIGWWLFHEHLGPIALVGGAVVLVSSYAAARAANVA